MLLSAAGRVVTREDISQRVLGRAFDPFDRSIDVHIGKVRRKLGDAARATSASRPFAASDTSMRSLAVKIFLSFWIAQVVILVGLEIFRPRAALSPAAPPPRRSPVSFLLRCSSPPSSCRPWCAFCSHAILRRRSNACAKRASGSPRAIFARGRGPWSSAARRIGDLVRDFDAMAERLHLLVSSQKQLLSDISHELRRRSRDCRWRSSWPDAKRDRTPRRPEPHRGGGHADERDDRPDPDACPCRQRQARGHRNLDLAEIVRRVATDTDYEARRTGRVVLVRHSRKRWSRATRP